MKLIKVLFVLAAMAAGSTAHAYCSVPYTPLQGASDFSWRMYYQDVEDYNRCMQQQQQEQQRMLQDMQRQQNNGGFNSGFSRGYFSTW